MTTPLGPVRHRQARHLQEFLSLYAGHDLAQRLADDDAEGVELIAGAIQLHATQLLELAQRAQGKRPAKAD